MTKTMVILGGAGGIGRCLVTIAHARGWQVEIVDISSSLQRHPVESDATAYAFDPESTDGLETALRKTPGQADAFVNLAGFAGSALPLTDTPDMAWSSVVEGNLTTAFRAAKLMAGRMAKGGAIVQVSSGLAYFARPDYGPYAAAKAGISALTRQLAAELAPNVRVNTISPSAVDTAFLAGGTGRSDEAQPLRVEKAAYAAANPMRRMAIADDIAKPILFLASEESGYITGQTLHVNGGAYMT